jgi:hypothetical protein
MRLKVYTKRDSYDKRGGAVDFSVKKDSTSRSALIEYFSKVFAVIQ